MGIYEIVNTPSNGGGGRLGPFRVLQILPCIQCKAFDVKMFLLVVSTECGQSDGKILRHFLHFVDANLE